MNVPKSTGLGGKDEAMVMECLQMCENQERVSAVFQLRMSSLLSTKCRYSADTKLSDVGGTTVFMIEVSRSSGSNRHDQLSFIRSTFRAQCHIIHVVDRVLTANSIPTSDLSPPSIWLPFHRYPMHWNIAFSMIGKMTTLIC